MRPITPVDLAAHYAYVNSQRHTRGDVVRAKRSLTTKAKRGALIGECPASCDIQARDEVMTTSRTKFHSQRDERRGFSTVRSAQELVARPHKAAVIIIKHKRK